MMPSEGKFVWTRQMHKRDDNEEELIWHLQAKGVKVDMIMGQNGIFDLLCDFEGLTFLIEVKNKRRKLSKTQELWWSDWTGPAYVCRKPDDIPAILQAVVEHYRKALAALLGD